jgi:hypothetical protein
MSQTSTENKIEQFVERNKTRLRSSAERLHSSKDDATIN